MPWPRGGTLGAGKRAAWAAGTVPWLSLAIESLAVCELVKRRLLLVPALGPRRPCPAPAAATPAVSELQANVVKGSEELGAAAGHSASVVYEAGGFGILAVVLRNPERPSRLACTPWRWLRGLQAHLPTAPVGFGVATGLSVRGGHQARLWEGFRGGAWGDRHLPGGARGPCSSPNTTTRATQPGTPRPPCSLTLPAPASLPGSDPGPRGPSLTAAHSRRW